MSSSHVQLLFRSHASQIYIRSSAAYFIKSPAKSKTSPRPRIRGNNPLHLSSVASQNHSTIKLYKSYTKFLSLENKNANYLSRIAVALQLVHPKTQHCSLILNMDRMWAVIFLFIYGHAISLTLDLLVLIFHIKFHYFGETANDLCVSLHWNRSLEMEILITVPLIFQHTPRKSPRLWEHWDMDLCVWRGRVLCRVRWCVLFSFCLGIVLGLWPLLSLLNTMTRRSPASSQKRYGPNTRLLKKSEMSSWTRGTSITVSISSYKVTHIYEQLSRFIYSELATAV
jgi:hypothetical protein